MRRGETPEVILPLVQVPGLDRPRLHQGVADLLRPVARNGHQAAIGVEACQFTEVAALVAEDLQLDDLHSLNSGRRTIGLPPQRFTRDASVNQ